MDPTLTSAVQILQEHASELRRRGVSHAAIFGSVARGEARDESDLDVLIELDPARPIGVFEYARLILDLRELLGANADIVNRKTLKPLLRESILRDSVHAF
jgi:predicted nucleotidyltransferase